VSIRDRIVSAHKLALTLNEHTSSIRSSTLHTAPLRCRA
jgi:hypothetical protein